MAELEVQTRDNRGELRFFTSVFEAFEYAQTAPEVWKVSWAEESGKRLRFTRPPGGR